MEERQNALAELREYIENVDNESTLLLQNLQWDPRHLTENNAMTTCKYDSNHRIPVTSKKTHEDQCYLTHEGYTENDVLLPDPVDPGANTIVKLSKEDFLQIINMASSSNPMFKRVNNRQFPEQDKMHINMALSKGAEPLTLERLQQAYTADERRAIHDAVVGATPFCHDLTDLALPSTNGEYRGSKTKGRMEILAELRDMKRRRAKYRVAAKTSNYSDVLRDVIKTQMELYAETKGIFIKTEYGPKSYITLNKPSEPSCNEITNIVIKQERMSPEIDRLSRRYKEGSRESYDDKQRKRHHDRDKQRDYDNKHRSSADRRSYDIGSNRHTFQTDRRRYDVQSKLDKHNTQGEHKDSHHKGNYKDSEEFASPSQRYYDTDYKHKNSGDYNTDRHYNCRSKEYDKHKNYSHSRDGNYSKSHEYHKHKEVDSYRYSRKNSEDHYYHKNPDKQRVPAKNENIHIQRNNDRYK